MKTFRKWLAVTFYACVMAWCVHACYVTEQGIKIHGADYVAYGNNGPWAFLALLMVLILVVWMAERGEI